MLLDHCLFVEPGTDQASVLSPLIPVWKKAEKPSPVKPDRKNGDYVRFDLTEREIQLTKKAPGPLECQSDQSILPSACRKGLLRHLCHLGLLSPF
jgi:hypothetical protein